MEDVGCFHIDYLIKNLFFSWLLGDYSTEHWGAGNRNVLIEKAERNVKIKYICCILTVNLLSYVCSILRYFLTAKIFMALLYLIMSQQQCK